MAETLKSILLCRWDGEAFIPFPHQRKLTDQLVVDANYWLTAPQDRRSDATHSHYFACLTKAFNNLPASETRFPTVESFRKWLLIDTRQCTERVIACATPTDAEKLAALVRGHDEYAVISVFGSVVRVWTPISQSRKAMGAKDFQESKQKVLEAAAIMIGVSVDELTRMPEPV